MSMDVGGAKGGVKSDINVTPLVDVMLVLLIIMMIVAPLLQKGADVRLPPRTDEKRVSRAQLQYKYVVPKRRKRTGGRFHSTIDLAKSVVPI